MHLRTSSEFRAYRAAPIAHLVLMSKAPTLALSAFCLVATGCKKDTPLRAAAAATNAPLSLKLLDGVVAQHVPIQIGGQAIEATIFSKNLGESALFLCFYTLPSAA